MDRVTQPPFKNSLEFKLPPAERILSQNENEIWFIPSSVGETVKIELIYKAGKYYETIPGTAQFTMHLLDKGARNKSSNEIANELDYFGAHLDLKCGNDFSSVSLYALNKNLDYLLPLLFSIVQDPEFPEHELDITRKIFIENLRVNLEKNEFVASNLIREKLYGTHPYGQSLQINDIEKLTQAGIKQFYRKWFKPFKIFIIGDVSSGNLKLITDNFKLSTTVKSGLTGDINGTIPDRYYFDGPNKKQASIRLGKRTISRKHPDWAGVQLANHVLGGYFGSRLMKNIREEKGLTYGIHSAIQSMFHATSLGISAEVNSDGIDLALKEIEKELSSLGNITKEELMMTKNHFIGSLQNDVTTVFAAAERIKSQILYNLSSDFYKNLILSVNKINEDEFSRITDTYFDSNLYTSIVVK
jgi:predicted Zn-dependent peptidase